MHLRVDSLNDWHQIVKNMFCVVHGGIHEVPEEENKTLIKALFKKMTDGGTEEKTLWRKIKRK